jgi:hypothetical protein
MTDDEDVSKTEKPPANDNAFAFGRPLVRGLRRRPGVRYARSGNVILPLVFAERLPGWEAAPHQLRRHSDATADLLPVHPPLSPLR